MDANNPSSRTTSADDYSQRNVPRNNEEGRREPAVSSENTFGQNSWLVDEMFQQYKEDPDSVDAEWRKLFDEKGAPKTAKGTPTVTPSEPGSSQPKTDPKVARTTGAPSQDGRETKVDEAASKAAAKPARSTLSLIHI